MIITDRDGPASSAGHGHGRHRHGASDPARAGPGRTELECATEPQRLLSLAARTSSPGGVIVLCGKSGGSWSHR